jgi:hypothetical protein
MKCAFAVAAVTFFLPGMPALAQQQAAPGGNILQLSLAALSQSQSAVDDVSLTGNVRRIAGSLDETGTCTLRMRESSGSRSDYSYPSGQLKELRSTNGSSIAGQWIGADGTAHSDAPHNLLTERAWFFPLNVIRHSLDTTHFQTVYVGSETLGDEAVQHFTYWRVISGPPESAAELQTLSRTEVYLDATTYLPVEITFNDHPDRDARTSIPVEVHYASYQVVDGTQIPFRIQQYRNHALSLDLQIETAVVNTGLSGTLFDLQ